jgi:hypothetical protein
MGKNQGPPNNIFNMPYDLNQKQVAIPITPLFTQDEAESNIMAFTEADGIHRSILEKFTVIEYPIQVHCLALPQFSASCWLQGVSVQRVEDRSGVRPPKTDVCLELTRTRDPMSGIMYITYSSLLYLATRALEIEQEPIVLVNNMLEQYAKKV